MIYNKQYEFLYIHVPRTAGTAFKQNMRRFNRVDMSRPYEGDWEHSTARDAIKYFDEDVWNNLFKFAFVRNPWDRAVSFYHYRKNSNQPETNTSNSTFREYILDSENHGRIFSHIGSLEVSQYDMLYSEDGKCLVDYVGRFENLVDDVNEVMSRIHLSRMAMRIKAKASEHDHYRNYYDDETREFIAKKFSKDIEVFGYEF